MGKRSTNMHFIVYDARRVQCPALSEAVAIDLHESSPFYHWRPGLRGATVVVVVDGPLSDDTKALVRWMRADNATVRVHSLADACAKYPLTVTMPPPTFIAANVIMGTLADLARLPGIDAMIDGKKIVCVKFGHGPEHIQTAAGNKLPVLPLCVSTPGDLRATVDTLARAGKQLAVLFTESNRGFVERMVRQSQCADGGDEACL